MIERAIADAAYKLQIKLHRRVRYTAPGKPNLIFELEETATFDGDRIRHLEDRCDAAEQGVVERYLRDHGAALGI